MRRIEQVSIFGRYQRRHRAAAVALVTAQDIGENCSFIEMLTARGELGDTPAGTDFWRGVNKYLHVGVGTDHGADITAIEHGPGRHRRKCALKIDQGSAHLRDR